MGSILSGGNQEQPPANVCWVLSILLVPTIGLQDTEDQSLCWAWNENHNQSQTSESTGMYSECHREK